MAGSRRPFSLRFVVVYLTYLLLCLVAVDYFVFWRPFVSHLRGQNVPSRPTLETPRYVDSVTAERLGSVNTDRQTSFVHFPLEKPAAKTRLCAFGDSFTHGDEVIDGHDYPALLQALFHRRGFDQIEVINFGSGWHGFHQVYLLWDAVGRQFHCDYVLLGPRCFQYRRDTRINHASLDSPYYLHARYVLDGDGLRLIEIPGMAYRARFDEYFRFLPHWDYLRYDRNLPPAIQAVLRPNTTLPNPFYYFRGSEDEEALATYRILLGRMSNDAPRILLLHDQSAVLGAATGLERANITAVQTYPAGTYPYVAPDDHFSAFGNQLVAEQFYGQLIAEPSDHLDVLATADAPNRPATPAVRREPLSSFESISVRLDEEEVGFFSTLAPFWSHPATGSAHGLKGTAVTSLLAIKSPATSWVDASYVALSFPLEDAMTVSLRTESAGSEGEVRLGTVRLLDPGLSIGKVELNVLGDARVGFRVEGENGLPLSEFGPTGSSFEVLVGGRPALKGTVGARSAVLTPLEGEPRAIRVGRLRATDGLDLPESGEIDLVLEHAKSGIARVPLASWRKMAVPMPRAEHPLADRLEPTRSGP